MRAQALWAYAFDIVKIISWVNGLKNTNLSNGLLTQVLAKPCNSSILLNFLPDIYCSGSCKLLNELF
jgi:hypothetical protein